MAVNNYLEALLIANERAQVKLTDEEILAKITRRYPSTAVNAAKLKARRWNYNTGIKQWRNVGPAGSEIRPVSYEYDSAGNRILISGQEALLIANERAQVKLTDDSDEDGTPVQQTVIHQSGLSNEEVRTLINAKVQEVLGQKQTLAVVVNAKPTKEFKAGTYHKKFKEAFIKLSAGIPVLLVGPTGSGKTFLAAQLAEALELPFTFNSMSAGVSESAIFGRSLPNKAGEWEFQFGPFAQTFINGGVHLFDEVDASDPNMLIAINAPLANGRMSIPQCQPEPFGKHPKFLAIFAANTFCNGASREYVGRNQLDAATVNRFTMGTVVVDYDKDVELSIAQRWLAAEQAKDLCDWAWKIRESINAVPLRRIMSTRNIEDSAKLGLLVSTLAGSGRMLSP